VRAAAQVWPARTQPSQGDRDSWVQTRQKGVFRLDREVRDLLDDYVRVRGARLVRTAFLISGDPQLAEDLVQSALASVIASWQRLPDVADLDAYLFRSIVNARHRWWRRRSSSEIPVESLPVACVDDGTDRFARHADMVAVLRSLPPKQRAAVVLRYYEDLSEAQAAEVLGCSVGTIKSQTSDGLAKLRAALGVDPTGRHRLARGAGEMR
jgi:RNA polymerase sigma-70 factor (sigma-E family)